MILEKAMSSQLGSKKTQEWNPSFNLRSRETPSSRFYPHIFKFVESKLKTPKVTEELKKEWFHFSTYSLKMDFFNFPTQMFSMCTFAECSFKF